MWLATFLLPLPVPVAAFDLAVPASTPVPALARTPGPVVDRLASLPKEVRAFWVVRHDLAGSPDASRDASRIAHEAVRVGANTLFVQVSGRGDAWYESDLLPPAEGLGAAEDPFALLLAAARDHDLSVHAWINVGLVWSRPRGPRAPDHVVNLRPEWMMHLPDGSSMADISSDTLRAWKVEGIFAELASPEYRHHVGEVVREVLAHYPVDGIHLDYIRRPNVDTGYDPTTLGQFEAETGLVADAMVEAKVERSRTTSTRHAWNWPNYSSDAPTEVRSKWNTFRQNTVTRAVERVRAVVDEVRRTTPGRDVLLSAAVIPEPVRALDRYAQAWPEWLEAGLLDFVVPMCYRPGRAGAENALQEVLALAPPESVVVGVACYNQPAPNAAAALRRVLDYPVRGACVFSFGALEADGFVGGGYIREAWLPEAAADPDDATVSTDVPPAQLGVGGAP